MNLEEKIKFLKSNAGQITTVRVNFNGGAYLEARDVLLEMLHNYEKKEKKKRRGIW